MIELIAPGDIYISEKQTTQFHKGMPYVIKNVYHKDGNLIATITDKWGKELLFVPNMFKTKNYVSQQLRHLRMTLEFWYDSDGTLIHWKGWGKPSHFFKVKTNIHYLSHPNSKCCVEYDMRFRKDPKDPWVQTSKEDDTFFNSKKECIDHFYDMFKKIYNEDYHSIHLDNFNFSSQEILNKQIYIVKEGIQLIDQACTDKLNTEFIDRGYNYQGRHYGHLDLNFTEYISYLNELIFDKKIDDAEVRKHVQTIINLYVAVPGSWAATACANVLLGKGKVRNTTTEPFWEKFVPLGLKMPQVFEFVDAVSTFLYHSKVFQTKDSYCSDKDAGYRGQYEFIGSKYIDQGKLEELLK